MLRATLRSKQRGTSVVEMAIVVSLFSLSVLGTIDLARAVWTRSQLGYAAASAARYAAVHGSNSSQPASAASLRDFISKHTQALSPKQLRVDATWNPDNKRGSVVNVSLRYDFNVITPILPFSSITFGSSARRVITN